MLRPSITPSAFGHTNRLNGILMQAGFNPVNADLISHAIGVFAMGTAMPEYGKSPEILEDDLKLEFAEADYLKNNFPNLFLAAKDHD